MLGMNLKFVLTVVMLLAPSAAFAGSADQPARTDEPTRRYVGASLDGGTLFNGTTYGAVTVDGGHRLADGPLWLRGAVSGGGSSPLLSFDRVSHGRYLAVRAGAELRTAGPTVRLVGGLDVGYRYLSYLETDRMFQTSRQTRSSAADVVPRVGLDIGRGAWRIRPTMEVSFDTEGNAGLALTIGLGHQF
jgi:hypothetical protein